VTVCVSGLCVCVCVCGCVCVCVCDCVCDCVSNLRRHDGALRGWSRHVIAH